MYRMHVTWKNIQNTKRGPKDQFLRLEQFEYATSRAIFSLPFDSRTECLEFPLPSAAIYFEYIYGSLPSSE